MAGRRKESTDVASLREVVERLSHQVEALTSAVDALTDELQWRNNQLRDRHGHRPTMTVVTSMPKDPCAKDWQLNRLSAADLPPDPAAAESFSHPPLFE